MEVCLTQPRIQHFNLSQHHYQELYQESIEHPQLFFANQAKHFLEWFHPWDHVISGRFQTPPIYWFMNGQLNMSYNCIDRHLAQHAHKKAIVWEGNFSDEQKTFSYQQLHDEVCRMANILKFYNIGKGDVVCIYMPMIPEAIFAMLACCRIGAIHNVVFGGFSGQSLANRINDSKAKFLFTANAAYRGQKLIPFKDIVDDALKDCPSIKHVLVVQRLDIPTKLHSNRDIWYHHALQNVDHQCPAEPMLSQDPLFILYTSGSTGKPKGIVHGTGGYALHVAMSYYYLFNHQPHTKHWCTADIGWITGHSYTVYGPLLNASTTIIYESVPNYPTFSRYPQIIERYQVTNFYTAPTALRTLRHEGPAVIESSNLSSLELLGSVGEPINPDVWLWYFEMFGQKRCPIINTWWQTESGGILLSPLPSDPYFIPGAAGKPFLGISPQIHKKNILYIEKPWPGLLQTIFNDQQRLIDNYLPEPELGYLTGDGASNINEQFQIQGRLDDIIKVSGHRFGTEELESAFVAHIAVSEAAVIGVPHPIKGEAIIAFIITQKHIQSNDNLMQLLKAHIRHSLGPIAQPEYIIWVKNLPKTRSGKIMRRILKKISSHDLENFGDMSSLAEPHVINDIIVAYQQQIKN